MVCLSLSFCKSRSLDRHYKHFYRFSSSDAFCWKVANVSLSSVLRLSVSPDQIPYCDATCSLVMFRMEHKTVSMLTTLPMISSDVVLNDLLRWSKKLWGRIYLYLHGWNLFEARVYCLSPSAICVVSVLTLFEVGSRYEPFGLFKRDKFEHWSRISIYALCWRVWLDHQHPVCWRRRKACSNCSS